MRGLVTTVNGMIELRAGSPQGQDQVNKLVGSWAGWKRQGFSHFPEGSEHRCSLYRARAWVSTFAPLLSQKTLRLEWDKHTKAFSDAPLKRLAGAMADLDSHSSYRAPAFKWQDEWNPDRKPQPHQERAIRALEWMDYRACLFDDMGLGKTSTSIWAWQQSGAPRLLVLCPKTVKLNWQREIWATLKETGVYIIDGSAKQRADTFTILQHAIENEDTTGRAVAIINYDLLHRLPTTQASMLQRWTRGQFLICDESHYLKNKKAKRTLFVYEHLAGVDHGAEGRLMLTGTPIRNTSEDLWAQLQVARPGLWSSFHQFDKLHLERKPMEVKAGSTGRTVTLNPVRRVINREQLNALVNTLQVRRAKEDVLDLPPKVFTYPEFELDPPTWHIYKKMRDFALIELAELGADTPIFHPQAKSALECTMRLEQIAQGFIGGVPEPYMDQVTPHLAKYAEKIEGHPGHFIFPKSAKIEWLKETIETVLLQGGQPVIFSRFNKPLFWLVKQWEKENAAILHGALSMKQRTDIIDGFQDKQIRVLFCQVKLSEGFNLTASQDVLFYGRDWSPAVNAQCAGRCHRIGQKGTVNVQIPIIRKTFEVFLHKKLAAKAADAESSLRTVTIGDLRKAL